MSRSWWAQRCQRHTETKTSPVAGFRFLFSQVHVHQHIHHQLCHHEDNHNFNHHQFIISSSVHHQFIGSSSSVHHLFVITIIIIMMTNHHQFIILILVIMTIIIIIMTISLRTISFVRTHVAVPHTTVSLPFSVEGWLSLLGRPGLQNEDGTCHCFGHRINSHGNSC